ncbi:hypothetical protein SARC_09585 [Sphaeroforma arctica JP610]|uniref:Thioredoxin domain-containing protein n=1 Tax=Sphaeroforma arctica JP610 TaxID=667725 RepID=A0A0L0FPR1_9EUKA|nr:hypothetical protein SARC_09585 [Sphaeroforma arctica JP610]KNC77963.1 hypothetical protein SARC_09585 [Sphaeroforma arctica JP610]|eukprot:XP_014151865.1 hypothetical protein SARC_09585 [Sphaeroforma arctica JP610]
MNALIYPASRTHTSVTVIRLLLLHTYAPAFQDVRDNQQVFVLGIFDSDDSIAAQKYRDAGKKFQKPRFYYTTEQTVADEVGAIGTGGISIVKQYDDLRTPFEGRDKWSTKDLMDFIEASWAPTVIEYTDESAHAIFKSNLKTQCLLFASRKNLEGFQECFSRIANEHKDEILFISVAVDDTELGVGSIVDYYAIKGEDPTLRIVNGDSKQRYIPDVTLTCETMENFVVDYLNGEVQSECEKPPPGWDQQPVKVLNDANYYEVAHDKSTYSFVFFYALWDPKSKGFQGKWEILAEYFEGDEEIVLAKMDYSNSAIEDYPVRQFPTLVLFGKDTNAYYEYAGKRDLGHLKKWIAEVRKGAIEETTPVKPQGKKQPDTAETDPNPTEENNVRDEGQHTAQHAEL